MNHEEHDGREGTRMSLHRALGPGYLGSIYKQAMKLELGARGLSHDSERPLLVRYRGIDIPGQRVDLIVENKIVVELKAVTRLDDVHLAQVTSYLKTAGLRAGLLVNFRVPVLKQGLRRIVL